MFGPELEFVLSAVNHDIILAVNRQKQRRLQTANAGKKKETDK